jgi:hypothetical protein
MIACENMFHGFFFVAEGAFVAFVKVRLLFVSSGPFVRREFEYWKSARDAEFGYYGGC